MLSKAQCNSSPRRRHARAQKRRSLPFDLGDLSVFIDATYWYFLKARANGDLFRWLNEFLVPRLAWPSSRRHSSHYHTERRGKHVRRPPQKFLQLTSVEERSSDDYIRPTFTPPRHAGSELIRHRRTLSLAIGGLIEYSQEHLHCVNIRERHRSAEIGGPPRPEVQQEVKPKNVAI